MIASHQLLSDEQVADARAGIRREGFRYHNRYAAAKGISLSALSRALNQKSVPGEEVAEALNQTIEEQFGGFVPESRSGL